tara:strand:- start:12135 stop:12905 length:771 start_codon:yes stop_codon:yes gene_type:complete
MPNWCDNTLIIYDNPEMDLGRVAGKLSKALDFEADIFDFQEIVPVPIPLLNKEKIESDNFTCINNDLDLLFLEQDIHDNWKDSYNEDDSNYPYQNVLCRDMLKELIPSDDFLMEQYNCKTSYDYRVEHWGCKWCGSELSFRISKKELVLYFQTPWGPPETIIKTIAGWFPDNDYQYTVYEPGCGLLYRETYDGDEHDIHHVDLGNSYIYASDYELLKEVDEEQSRYWKRNRNGNYELQEEEYDEDCEVDNLNMDCN